MAQHIDLVASLKKGFGPNAFSTIMDFQPLNAYLANISLASGGNMLGLEHSPRNKLYFVVGVTMISEAAQHQLPQITQQVQAMAQRIVDFAESLDSKEDFIYLNYARAWQNPLGSYGADNVDFMKRVAKKYDCGGFFQRRVSGGFKLANVP
jgi:hypothetical protein